MSVGPLGDHQPRQSHRQAVCKYFESAFQTNTEIRKFQIFEPHKTTKWGTKAENQTLYIQDAFVRTLEEQKRLYEKEGGAACLNERSSCG